MCFCLSNSVVSSLGPPGKYHQMKYSFSPQTFLMYYLDVAQIEEDKICLFMLLLCCESHSVVSNSLWPHGLHSGWNSPGQNSGVGSLSLLQGIFPTQGSKPGLCIAGRFFTNRAVYHVGSPKYLRCCSAIRNMITTVFLYLKSFDSSSRLGNECNFIYGPTP